MSILSSECRAKPLTAVRLAVKLLRFWTLLRMCPAIDGPVRQLLRQLTPHQQHLALNRDKFHRSAPVNIPKGFVTTTGSWTLHASEGSS